jgi:hypothetical protein
MIQQFHSKYISQVKEISMSKKNLNLHVFMVLFTIDKIWN